MQSCDVQAAAIVPAPFTFRFERSRVFVHVGAGSHVSAVEAVAAVRPWQAADGCYAEGCQRCAVNSTASHPQRRAVRRLCFCHGNSVTVRHLWTLV